MFNDRVVDHLAFPLRDGHLGNPDVAVSSRTGTPVSVLCRFSKMMFKSRKVLKDKGEISLLEDLEKSYRRGETK